MSKNDLMISVIMGIYNCEKTLGEAIESVLNQSYTNWELILCDDGSTDRTFQIAKDYQMNNPNKIILLKNETNQGLNATLNRCLSVAKGKYIARMDGDDRCSNIRFEKELKVFSEDSELSIVSTDMEYFDESGTWGSISHPTNPTAKDFLHGTPFCHAPCLVKKEAYMAVDGYTEDTRLLRVEDYHLWVKMYKKGFKGRNIHEPLYQMRDDRNAYARRKLKYRINEAYVRYLAVKELKLSAFGYILALRPILVGLLPSSIYDFLHKRNLGRIRG